MLGVGAPFSSFFIAILLLYNDVAVLLFLVLVEMFHVEQLAVARGKLNGDKRLRFPGVLRCASVGVRGTWGDLGGVFFGVLCGKLGFGGFWVLGGGSGRRVLLVLNGLGCGSAGAGCAGSGGVSGAVFFFLFFCLPFFVLVVLGW